MRSARWGACAAWRQYLSTAAATGRFSSRMSHDEFSAPTSRRSYSSESDGENKVITATLFPGDGIGPEIAQSVKEVSCRFLECRHRKGLVFCL